jgi:hypothetical protein
LRDTVIRSSILFAPLPRAIGIRVRQRELVLLEACQIRSQFCRREIAFETQIVQVEAFGMFQNLFVDQLLVVRAPRVLSGFARELSRDHYQDIEVVDLQA